MSPSMPVGPPLRLNSGCGRCPPVSVDTSPHWGGLRFHSTSGSAVLHALRALSSASQLSAPAKRGMELVEHKFTNEQREVWTGALHPGVDVFSFCADRVSSAGNDHGRKPGLRSRVETGCSYDLHLADPTCGHLAPNHGGWDGDCGELHRGSIGPGDPRWWHHHLQLRWERDDSTYVGKAVEDRCGYDP